MGEAEPLQDLHSLKLERDKALCWPALMATPWAVWLVAKLPGWVKLSETWEQSLFPPLLFLFFPFSFTLVDFSLFLLLLHSFLCLLPLAFVPFLSLFYFSLFFSISLLFIKKQISLSLLPCFSLGSYPTHLFIIPSASCPCASPHLLLAPTPVSFAHAEITADKRAPPCTTVLHEALCTLVLGSLASPPSLLGGVP